MRATGPRNVACATMRCAIAAAAPVFSIAVAIPIASGTTWAGSILIFAVGAAFTLVDVQNDLEDRLAAQLADDGVEMRERGGRSVEIEQRTAREVMQQGVGLVRAPHGGHGEIERGLGLIAVEGVGDRIDVVHHFRVVHGGWIVAPRASARRSS